MLAMPFEPIFGAGIRVNELIASRVSDHEVPMYDPLDKGALWLPTRAAFPWSAFEDRRFSYRRASIRWLVFASGE